MKKFFFAIMVLISISIFSQEKTVSGTVVDEAGIPLGGANIVEKGVANGTQTDFDGNFSITVGNSNAILQISYVGFIAQEIAVNSKNTFSVILLEDAQALDEVIVVGYETIKKKDLTGAVATVDTDKAFLAPTASLDNGIQGRASGVQVTTSSGEPGSEPVIVIRGGNSITGGNDPLFVVDGFVGADNISTLNPNDIESIQILKDAASTAIYGARGTNGVVIVTTKRGRTGKPVVNFRASSGIQTIPGELDVQTPRELAQFFNNSSPDQDNLPFDVDNLPGTVTNWQDVLTQSAIISDYQLSVSGGSEAAKYFVSTGYLNQDGIVRGSGFERYSIRSNIDFKLSEIFTAGINLSLSRTERENNTVSFTDLLREDPSKPVFDEEGNFFSGNNPILGNQTGNVLADALLNDDNTTLSRVFINTHVGAKFFNNKLNWKSTFGGDFTFNQRQRFTPSTSPSFILNNNQLAEAIINRSNAENFLNENTITYQDTFGDHFLNILLGSSFQTENNESITNTAGQIPSDGVGVNAIQLAPAENVSISSSFSETHRIGFFGKVRYMYKGKYIATASIRRDGASTLGINQRYRSFPSASLGWTIKEESFLADVDAVNNLKLRINYGRTGNSGVTPFNTIASFGIDNNTILVDGVTVPGVTQNNLAKPNLGWEVTDQYDAGVEFAFFNSRLSGEIDVYYKKTSDLLLEEDTPDFTGFSTLLANVGSVQNKGLDITLNATMVKTNNFQWDASLNISTFKNEILDLGQSTFIAGNRLGAPANDESSRLIVGEPIGIFYGANYLGFDPETGAAIFEDISGPDGEPDGIYTPEFDDQIIGNANPDFFGGLQTNFRYKHFDLAAFFAFSVGNENYSEEYFRVNEVTVNSFADIRDGFFSPQNTENALFPAIGSANYDLSSSLYVQDASYLRLSTLQVGYNLPSETINGVSKLRLYFTGTNLFLINDDDYVGFDPDVSTGNRQNLERGFDAIAYPKNRGLLIGLDVSF